MITAIDSSVIIAIAKNEASARAWVALLAILRASGSLAVSEAVWAETRPCFHSHSAQITAMESLGMGFLPMTEAAAALAGEIHADYRRAGGSRQKILGDFLIGAHAFVQANQLASADDGFFRVYFRGLKITAI